MVQGKGSTGFNSETNSKNLPFLLSRFRTKGLKCGIKYHDIYVFQPHRTTLCLFALCGPFHAQAIT